jgi:Family of unknown function (DUF5519)
MALRSAAGSPCSVLKPGVSGLNKAATLRNVKRAGELIKESVLSWPGVEAVPHRFGGTEYRYGRKEMGHVHGDRLADLPLPRTLHDEVIAAGRAEPHHVLPETGWVSCWMKSAEDAANVIELFRVQYERYAAAKRI